MSDIYRYIVYAKPSENNRKYRSWETATLIIFIREDSTDLDKHFKGLLKQHRWEILLLKRKDLLIKEKVKAADPKIWEAYKIALERGNFFLEQPDNFGAGTDDYPILAPRINEAFADKFMEHLGGRRLTQEEKDNELTDNADYLIEDHIIELKELREEGLEKHERQTKIADIFLPYAVDENFIVIDPSILNEEDYREYLKLVGAPIKRHIKKAAKQIKRTKKVLNDSSLKGGIILLNSGYSSLPHPVFVNLCSRYISKDTNQVQSALCVSVSLSSNGFDSMVVIESSIEGDQSELFCKMYNSCLVAFFEMIQNWTRSGCTLEAMDLMLPLHPVSFVRYGKVFSWLPKKLAAWNAQ